MSDPFLKGKAGRIDRVTVPPMRYLAIEGQGAPEGPNYAVAVQALYALAYGARFAGKARGHEEKVGPLEGLWWADDMDDFLTGARATWRWRMMIRAPSWLITDDLIALRHKALAKRGDQPGVAEALTRVDLIDFDEGLCLQALHIGPYADEGPLIARIHAEGAAQGLVLRGLHHEIYLSDPRKVDPARLKTILRQPMGG